MELLNKSFIISLVFVLFSGISAFANNDDSANNNDDQASPQARREYDDKVLPAVTIETAPMDVVIKGKTYQVVFRASSVETHDVTELAAAVKWAQEQIKSDQKQNPGVKIQSSVVETKEDKGEMAAISEQVLPDVTPSVATITGNERGDATYLKKLKRYFTKDRSTVTITISRMLTVGIPMAIGMYTAKQPLDLSITTGITCAMLSGGLQYWGVEYRNWLRSAKSDLAQYARWVWTELGYLGVLNISTLFIADYFDFAGIFSATAKGLVTQGWWDVAGSLHENYSLRKLYMGGKTVDFDALERERVAGKHKVEDFTKKEAAVHFAANLRTLVVSGFAMSGLVLGMHGIPLGNALLVGLGVAGFPYWAIIKYKEKQMTRMMNGFKMDYCEAKLIDSKDRTVHRLLKEFKAATAPQLASQ